MNYTILFAIIAMICLGLSDFFYKRARDRGITAGSFLFTQAFFFGMATIVFALLTEGIHASSVILKYALLSGILFFMAYMFFLKSLSEGSVSINSVIFRLSFIITSVFAVLFLSESLSLIKITGFLFAVLAIVSFSLQKDSRTLNSSVIYSLLAMFLFGTGMFLWKMGAIEGASPVNYFIVQFLSFSTLAFILLKISEKKLNLGRHIIQYAPFCGFLQAVANILILKSLETSAVTIIAPIIQLSFIVTAIMAILIIKEKLTLRKLIGLFFAVLAVVMLGLSTI